MKMSRHLGRIWFGAVTIVASLSANAALFIVGGSSQPLPLTGNNFNADLQGLGYTQMISGGQLRVSQDGFVTYTYIGAESAFNNSFNTPSGSMVENDEAFNISGYDSITVSVSYNDILNFNFTSDGGANALTPVDNYFSTNLQGLGIFTGASSQQVILGYDDQNSISADDNHDDMMILVNFSTVPLPAAIWLFGTGMLGLIGIARRKK